jgi:resuscitation-promoting factor RpfB
MIRYLILAALGLTLAGCAQEEPTIFVVRLQVDGSEYVYQHTEPITVEQFIGEAEEVELSNLDRVYPEPWTQIYDGIRITIIRVAEEEYCEEIEISYREETQPLEGLAPGEQRMAQQGENGIEQICYRVQVENGEQQEPTEISRIVLQESIDEIIYVGPIQELEPVPIMGTLAYVGNRNAWIIRGNSTRKRLLTTTGDLDRRVFALSENGEQLIFTRETPEDATFNQLWIVPDTITVETEVIRLVPQDILYGEWVPNAENTISYSTAEKQNATPGWRAFNDLWIMTIDPETGDQIRIEQLLDQSSGGIYGWWGTSFKWSPDGSQLAWVRADSIGLVDLEVGELTSPPLFQFSEFNPLQNWSWRADISWSPDGNLLMATTHGPPIGNEAPATSPVFDIQVTNVEENYQIMLVDKAGIWSSPKFSPSLPNVESRIAYLQARQWDTSISGEYDLAVADRDGSNAQVVFPEATQPGLTAQEFAQDFTWSPDGKQIALIYQGDLWVVDVDSGSAYRITQDGGASNPVWTP